MTTLTWQMWGLFCPPAPWFMRLFRVERMQLMRGWSKSAVFISLLTTMSGKERTEIRLVCTWTHLDFLEWRIYELPHLWIVNQILSCQSNCIHTYLTEWVSDWLTDRLVHFGQITSNFLKQTSRRLYEIRQPLTSLFTTRNFLIKLPTSSWSPWSSWLPRPWWSCWSWWSWWTWMDGWQDRTGKNDI